MESDPSVVNEERARGARGGLDGGARVEAGGQGESVGAADDAIQKRLKVVDEGAGGARGPG